jgi:uncharacterized glyoxalase superfamily protein PhnB
VSHLSVTPWIVSRDSARLIAFLEAAFDGKEKEGTRTLSPDGKIVHAEVTLGPAAILLFDAKEQWPETPAFLRLFVEDVDSTYQRALDAGAHVVTRVTELSSGDRVGRVVDPLGNVWWIQTAAAEPPEDELARSRDPNMISAHRYVQQTLDDELMRRKGLVLGPRGITVDSSR